MSDQRREAPEEGHRRRPLDRLGGQLDAFRQPPGAGVREAEVGRERREQQRHLIAERDGRSITGMASSKRP